MDRLADGAIIRSYRSPSRNRKREAALNTHQVAKAIGVSESSLKRWCDKGMLATQRTAGGHRRLTIEAVLEFVRGTGQEMASPS